MRYDGDRRNEEKWVDFRHLTSVESLPCFSRGQVIHDAFRYASRITNHQTPNNRLNSLFHWHCALASECILGIEIRPGYKREKN